MGYGDYGANTGPIDIYNYNPNTASLNFEVRFGTEAIEIFRPIHNKLYVPSIDPAYMSASHDYAIRSNGVWSTYNQINGTHIYDFATYDGQDLWMVGSLGRAAMSWRSFDQGLTWYQEKVVMPVDSQNDFSRFYFAGTLNGKLYLQPKDFRSARQRSSLVYSGGQWSEGPKLLGSGSEIGSKTLNYRHYLLVKGAMPNRIGKLYYFDGQKSKAAKRGSSVKIYDYTIYNQQVYILDSQNRIYKTVDFVNWDKVTSVGSNKGRSIEIINNTIYIGTTDSNVLKERL